MLFNILNILSLVKTTLLVEGQQFQLFDSKNPEFLLAARGNSLFFITVTQSKIQGADTVFTIKDKRLKLGTKEVCDYGISGRELWLCEYVKSFSTWSLEPIPFEFEMFTIKEWSGKKCAVYGELLFDNERKIEVGPCQGDVAIFKTVFIDEFITKGKNENLYADLNVYPHRQMIPNQHIESFLPEKLTLNV